MENISLLNSLPHFITVFTCDYVSVAMGQEPGKSYIGEGSASLKKLFGDQREDSLTSLKVCFLL